MVNAIKNYDVIVVGGGHAGIEAAYTSARMGAQTLLITQRLDRLGYAPCNPAIGGIGKSHIVFEISAFGGIMPQLCTHAYLQVRMLNTRKGPAVQGLRIQIDKYAYCQKAREILEQTENLTLLEDKVLDLLIQDDTVSGVITQNESYHAPTVIITTGTFLNGRVHIGLENYAAGRTGENATEELATTLKKYFSMERLKTGTPPRLLKSSIDFSCMEEQKSDNLECLFEFEPHKITHKHSCYITYTNQKSHDIITNNAHLSPIFTGTLTGTPPRYCPSIEVKISRFAHKTAHHIFVEPESASCNEIYPNGISTSLPQDVQEKFIRTIRGFENAVITQPGYAIEYDFIMPNQLNHTLETKKIAGLYCAGQINGTTGYEEAAGQGMLAAINAVQKIRNKEPYIISRTQGYIGVMIDDLVTFGVDEPYRMFTSRAERRLLLRQDNAFYRFADDAHKLGLISSDRYKKTQEEAALIKETAQKIQSGPVNKQLMQLQAQNEVDLVHEALDSYAPRKLNQREHTALYAEFLYGPYMQRELREIEKAEQFKDLLIPPTLNYTKLDGLSTELREKLNTYKPKTIAHASLIQGMTPAALSILIFKSREFINS